LRRPGAATHVHRSSLAWLHSGFLSCQSIRSAGNSSDSVLDGSRQWWKSAGMLPNVIQGVSLFLSRRASMVSGSRTCKQVKCNRIRFAGVIWLLLLIRHLCLIPIDLLMQSKFHSVNLIGRSWRHVKQTE
jgi:hypothetical protein